MICDFAQQQVGVCSDPTQMETKRTGAKLATPAHYIPEYHVLSYLLVVLTDSKNNEHELSCANKITAGTKKMELFLRISGSFPEEGIG